MNEAIQDESLWNERRLLIWGKTYPEWSKKYYETVCTGAIDSETGRLVRIYPVTLRHLREPFSKYQWITAKVQRNPSDRRPESFRIAQESIGLQEKIDTSKDGWAERCKYVLGEKTVFKSVRALELAERTGGASLGLVKPKEIRRFYLQHLPPEARAEWEADRERAIAQKDLFVDAEALTKELRFMPVRYRVQFLCDDPACQTLHDMSILDWEIYVLSRKLYAERGAQRAERDVIRKLEQLVNPAKRDAYLFLGNTLPHPQSFMVVGLFCPPRERQGLLF